MKLKDWLAEEPFTLTLSSGFFGFFAHTGVLTVLEEEGLMPQKVLGASSGALAGSCWAAGIDSINLREILFDLKRQDFWDIGFGLGLLKGQLFKAKLGEILPVKTFEECPIPLALSGYDLRSKSTVVLDSGDLVPAIYASCAIPFLFQPIEHQGYKLLDGGIKDRPALAAATKNERIFFHHIASKSSWRKKDAPSIQIPKRDNLASMAIYDLPRSGPTKLEVGKEAYQRAYFATRRALNMELINSNISIAG